MSKSDDQPHPRPPQQDAPVGPGDEEIDLLGRLAFLGLHEADAERLRQLAPLFEASRERFVQHFYRHLFAFEQSARFLQDESLVQRLKQAQQEHFQDLLEGRWDDQFVQRRRRVGHAHAQIGIQPPLFLGAYNLYLQHWIREFARESADPDALKLLSSLVRAVLLDIGLTLDAYFAQSTAEMRRALQMYWRANHQLRQFAQLASHDMKTPLATIANLCDEALDEFGDQMPAEAAELVERARDRVFRISSTIDELLTSVVRSDQGEHETLVALQPLLEEEVEQIRPLLEEKDIEVTLGELPVVQANRALVREVFANLLSNAAKFIDKIPGLIEVTAEPASGECVIAVRDNGPGIPNADLQRIFFPFRSAAAQRHNGSGLGLYFARSLVEQLGGRIWAESEPGRGSTFYVALKKHE